MVRAQSPGYPNASLPKAIQSARQIFDADRRNPIDREVAAKHIGYSGSSGAADKALATLAHYGLTEKVGKGEIRVSQLALDIIHPEKPEDRKKALMQAAFKSQIFTDLRERFPGGHVSEGALESYLKRENFLDRAINPVTKAYLETCRYLEQEKAFESGGSASADGQESSEMRERANTAPEDDSDIPVQFGRSTKKERPKMEGERTLTKGILSRDASFEVLVSGRVGVKEIERLIQKLELDKEILAEPDTDALDDDDDYPPIPRG